jgi:Mg-chelatase subunit ChlD/DNA-binding beta-propeller fold protein YncE
MPALPVRRRAFVPSLLAGAALVLLLTPGLQADISAREAWDAPDARDAQAGQNARDAQKDTQNSPQSEAVPVAIWPLGAIDPLAIAVLPDGTSYTLSRPLRTQPDFESLVRRDAAGQVIWERVPRDMAGLELRPVTVEAGTGGLVYVASADKLVALDPAGLTLWEAPAGDGRAEFGPAARGLALAADGENIFGLDLVNARLLGYRAAGGALRLRLGTEGDSPGFYRTPVDLAVGPGKGLAGDKIFVAERGNSRLQVLDAQGNPLAQWPLPARPRAVTVAPAGDRVFVLLEDERVLSLNADDGSPSIYPYPPIGGFGRVRDFQLAQDIGASDTLLYVLDRGNRRIQLFDHRLHADGGTETPTPSPTAIGLTPTAVPPIIVSACPSRPATLDFDVQIPSAPPRADVMLVFDTTGSMESLISTAQMRAVEMADGLRAISPDVAIGVMDVRDYPYGVAGLASDWPWLLRGPLSTKTADLIAATADLWPGGGGDAPEAYAGAIAAAMDDPAAGWRADAGRYVVIFGDSVPRDQDLNEGISNPRLPSPWRPGRPSWWTDSGPDWAPGSADDIDWQTLLVRMADEDVTLLAGINGAAPAELLGITADLVGYWRNWTGRTGGTAVDLTNVGRLPAALAEMLGEGGRHIDRLHVAVAPAGQAAWVVATPPEYLDIGVPDGGTTRSFAIAIEPPADTAEGRYTLRLTALGDGARYGLLDVVLDWRSDCLPEMTMTPSPPIPSETPTLLPPSETPSPSPSATDGPTPSATATSEITPTPGRSLAYLPILMRGHCLAGARKPADIVLVLDTSSSMSGAKLAAAVRAAGIFLDLVGLPRDHVALVSFNSRASLDAGLTGSKTTLALALATPRTAQGTRIDLGLEAATAELRSPRARAEALPVIVLLTDGRPDGGSEQAVRSAASAARAAGVTVFAIGLGTDVDAGLLREVAGDPARYYEAPDAEDLERIYRGLALDLPCR